MPTIFREGPYRFFFYSGDRGEPIHVHVEREDKLAKFWLDPVRLAWSGGYNRAELLKIQKLIDQYHESIVEAWHEYFGD